MDPIQWYQDPKEWLSDLREHAEAQLPEAQLLLSWLVTQHQILTLAKYPSTSSLWFKLNSQPFAIWGAALSQGRLVLACPEIDVLGQASQSFNPIIASIFKQRFEPQVLIATPQLNAFMTFKGSDESRQTSWWRPHWTRISPIAPDLHLRRAQESDRKLVLAFAEAFSSELQTDARAEAMGWLNRHRLLLFEKNQVALGMAALSGEYQDDKVGSLTRVSLVFVVSEARGKGTGTAILNSIAAECVSEKKNLVLFSDTTNEAATKFYSRCGFVSMGALTEFRVKTTG
jgi:GNAT superfamily N-acetyltransferase